MKTKDKTVELAGVAGAVVRCGYKLDVMAAKDRRDFEYRLSRIGRERLMADEEI